MANQKVCETALEQYENELSRLPNVVGLGIVPVKEGEHETEDLAVAVYVERKISEKLLTRDQIVPKTISVELKGLVEEVPTKVIEQGRVQLESADDEVDFFNEPM